MRNLNFLSGVLSLLLAIAFNVSALEAQLVGKWTTVFEKPPDPTLEQPTFVDDRGPGNNLVGTRATAMVTWNSGEGWREVYSLPSKTVSDADRIMDGAFVDVGHYLLVIRNRTYKSLGQGSFSWIDKHRMLVSTDGGQEWENVGLPETPHMTLSMLNNREGLVAIEEEGSASLYSTTDGGLTWSRELAPENVRFFKALMIEPSVWAGTVYNMVDSTFRFYRTTDRGQTWPRSEEDASYMRGFGVVNGQVLFSAGQKFNDSGSPSGYLIRKSIDGGMTWRTVLDTARQYAQLLYEVDFADSLHGLAVGNRSSVWRTTNGGESWFEEPPSDELGRQNEFLLDVAYPAIDDAIVVSSRTGVMAYRGGQVLAPPVIIRPDSNLQNLHVAATIEWTPINGASSYEVEIGDTAYTVDNYYDIVFDDPWLDSIGITGTSLDVVLEERTHYRVRVRALNDESTGLWSQVLRILSEGEGKVLAQPEFISPYDNEREVPTDFEFAWRAVPDAVGYDLQLRHSLRFPIIHYAADHLPATSHVIEGMRPDTIYYAELRARDADGVTSEWTRIRFYTGEISSMEEQETLLGITLYPTVITDRALLFFPASMTGEAEIRMVSVDGREVMRDRVQLSGSGLQGYALECAGLVSGQYFVVIENEGARAILPVTVVR